MTFRDVGRAIVAAMVLGGCANDLDWRAITSAREFASPRWLWRNEHELWGVAGRAVLRRTDGAWEEVLLCGEALDAPSMASSVSFDGEDVWVVCGDFGAQSMLRHRGGAAEPISPPFDGGISLVPVTGAVVVLGETGLHAWRDGSWETIAPVPVGAFPAASVLGCAGRAEDEIYCSMSGSPLQHWSGSAWSETDVTGLAPPELRAGDVWLGAGRLVAGAYEDFAGATDRGTVAITVVPPSTVIWAGGDEDYLYLWRAERGSGSLEYLGTAPALASVSPGGTSGGSNILYAIDRDTFVMVNAGTSLSGSSSTISEGRL